MKEIERKEGRNNDIPKREVYYYGLKETSCYLVRTVELNGYIFELYYYGINNNGEIYVEMYDSSRKRLFSELTITLKFNWGFKYKLEFFNDENQKSNKYIYFIWNY